MRKILLGLAVMLFSSSAIAQVVKSFYTHSTGSTGRISVTVSQGNAKLKWSEPTKFMSILDPSSNGFTLNLKEGGSLAKGACVTVNNYESCPDVTVVAGVQTSVEYEISGGLEGVGDGQGSGKAIFLYQGLGDNTILQSIETRKLASITYWGPQCDTNDVAKCDEACPVGYPDICKTALNAFCAAESEAEPC